MKRETKRVGEGKSGKNSSAYGKERGRGGGEGLVNS